MPDTPSPLHDQDSNPGKTASLSPNSGKNRKSRGFASRRAAPSSTESSSRPRLRPPAPTEPVPSTPRSAASAPKANCSASSAPSPGTAPLDHPAMNESNAASTAGSISHVIGSPASSLPPGSSDTETSRRGSGPAPERMPKPVPCVPSRAASSRENRTAAPCPARSTRTATKATTSSNDTPAPPRASLITSCVPCTIPAAPSRHPPTDRAHSISLRKSDSDHPATPPDRPTASTPTDGTASAGNSALSRSAVLAPTSRALEPGTSSTPHDHPIPNKPVSTPSSGIIGTTPAAIPEPCSAATPPTRPPPGAPPNVADRGSGPCSGKGDRLTPPASPISAIRFAPHAAPFPNLLANAAPE